MDLNLKHAHPSFFKAMPQENSKKPNIIFIIVDHQAWFGHHRPEYNLRLPCYEQFCADGARFDRAYCVQPLCTPSRSSMMSGVYPSVHGMLWNTEGNHWLKKDSDFAPGLRLFNEYLADAGYRNAYIGKWHCSHGRMPEDFGWEGWSLPEYGNFYISDKYQAYCKERGLGDARARIEYYLGKPEWVGKTLTLHDPSSPWTFMNGAGVLLGPPEAHEENFVAHLATEKIKELAGGGQPWSLVASFWGPHQPYYPSEAYAGRIDPKSIPPYPSFDDPLDGKPLRHLYHRDITHGAPRKQWPTWDIWQNVVARAYEQQLQLDDAIDGMLKTLDDLGQRDNTMVVWLADHGDALASHGGVWDKHITFTEEVGRIPLAIRWPAGIPAGGRTGRLVSNMDATATILDAAGVQVPAHMNGRSLLPLCRDAEGAAWPDHLVCEHYGHVDPLLQRIIVTERYKYGVAEWDADELYDLQEDPYEMKNLSSDPKYADVKSDLSAKLIGHIEKHKDHRAQGKIMVQLRRNLKKNMP
jgi:arylsulfatase A-like enzyme